MALAMCTLTVEMDLVHDALADVEQVMRALVKRHGQAYRDLERRVERFMDGEIEWGEPKSHWIGGGRIVFEPWPELKVIIREARELGVLP